MPRAATARNKMHRKRLQRAGLLSLVLALLASLGCQHFWPKNFGPPPPITVPVSNPAHVGAVDPTFLWQQIVDTVDDYFRIARPGGYFAIR